MNTKMTNTSPATAITAVGDVILTDLEGYRSLVVEAVLQGATGGTLDVYLQVTYDGGATWTDYAHFAQLAAGAAAIRHKFAVCRDVEKLTIVTPGKGTSPTLTVNTVVGGDWGSAMRMLFVAGASTSAGAAQTVNVFGSK
jgi:hypothetical protein